MAATGSRSTLGSLSGPLVEAQQLSGLEPRSPVFVGPSVLRRRTQVAALGVLDDHAGDAIRRVVVISAVDALEAATAGDPASTGAPAGKSASGSSLTGSVCGVWELSRYSVKRSARD